MRSNRPSAGLAVRKSHARAVESTVRGFSGSQIARACAPCERQFWCLHGVRARASCEPLWR
eukprot:11213842-Lingulodinium_polyedra.AAC.1